MRLLSRKKFHLQAKNNNGISFFTEIYKQSEYTAPYIIKDSKWYEQGRGIYSDNNQNPARFFIYKKVD